MQALRRGIDRVALNAERGLLESQQTLALARPIGRTPGSA
jgi:hypothetical protein